MVDEDIMLDSFSRYVEMFGFGLNPKIFIAGVLQTNSKKRKQFYSVWFSVLPKCTILKRDKRVVSSFAIRFSKCQRRTEKEESYIEALYFNSSNYLYIAEN